MNYSLFNSYFISIYIFSLQISYASAKNGYSSKVYFNYSIIKSNPLRFGKLFLIYGMMIISFILNLFYYVILNFSLSPNKLIIIVGFIFVLINDFKI